MVEIGGKPILHHQLEAFAANGIDDVVVIGGYKRNGIVAPGATFISNTEFMTNNILMSLFCATDEFVGDVVVSYGDIVYSAAVVERLLASPNAASLVVDVDWAKTYEGRTDHPLDQAELAEATSGGVIKRVGKAVGAENALGEFIGLAQFKAPMVGLLWGLYLRALSRGDHLPYGDAPTFRKAYLTDLLNDAIGRGEHIGAVPIAGGWREIDTVQDLERAQESGLWS
jgi:choline kinase